MSAFKPADVYPCTVDEEIWNGGVNVKSLFGHLCSGTNFAYDDEVSSLRRASQDYKRLRDRLDSEEYEKVSPNSNGLSRDERDLRDTSMDESPTNSNLQPLLQCLADSDQSSDCHFVTSKTLTNNVNTSHTCNSFLFDVSCHERRIIIAKTCFESQL